MIIACWFISCKKVCVDCNKQNTPPLANAGNDIIIRLPVDSVMLDGSASYDPDGKVGEYLWTQLSGPSASEIIASQHVKTNVRKLQQGTYSFELRIKDNGGMMSKDTIVVSVRATSSGKIKVSAGPDQVIGLLTGQAHLNGSRSHDSSALPLNHKWRQIAGPASQLLNSNLAIATVLLSVANIYEFELRGWNANGEAYDTMQVTVINGTGCYDGRAEVPAQLIPLKQFGFSSYNIAKMLAVGNKLIIPVDGVDPIAAFSVIIYDVATGTFTQKELSPRVGAATAVVGNKVFFAGGFTDFNDDQRPGVTDEVDIYDAAFNTWSTARLREARGAVKAGGAGGKVVFAGGLKSNVLSNKVDIYDLETNQWTTSQLAGEPRAIERVVADGSNIYFLGGNTVWQDRTGFGYALTIPSKSIDIYNVASGTWSRSNMQVERYGFSAVLVDNKIMIAGGSEGIWPNDKITSNVEVITLPTMACSITCLANPAEWRSETTTAIKDGSVIFYLGGSAEKRKFEIYNPQTGVWTLGVYDFNVLGQYESAALASLNNQVYVLKGNKLFSLHY